MKYDPEITLKYKFNQNEDSAFHLCCIWSEISKKLFPDYMHSKFPKLTSLKRSIIFKTMLKLMKERNFKSIEEYTRFIKAQLLIFKKIQKQGHPVLIEPTILVGEPSERRWFYWKKLVQQTNAITKMTYTLKDADLEFDLTVSAAEVKKICEDNLSFDNYLEKQSKIRTSIILRRLKPVYVHLSEWIAKFPDDLKNDFLKRADAKAFEGYDLNRAKELYKIIFSFEL